MQKVIGLPDLQGWTALLTVGIAVLSFVSCARSPEQQYARFLERGKAQLQKRDYRRAAVELQNCIQLKPTSAEARYELALAQLGEGNIRAGVASLWKTLQLDPKYAAAELKLSEIALGTRDPAEAQEVKKRIGKIIEDSPASADALNLLAAAERQLGKSDEAEKLLLEASSQFPKDLRAALSLANLKLEQKDLAGAEAVLKKAAADNPTLAEGGIALGQFYVRTARLADAEQAFQQALRIDPKNAHGLASLAELQWRLGHTDQADQLFKKASDLGDLSYRPLHAVFLFRSGKRNEAIAEFEQQWKAAPQDRAARSRLVAAYRLANRASDAEAVLSEALKKNPKDTDALLQRSETYVNAGKYSEARTDLTTVLRFRPDSGMAHYLLAKVNQKSGDTVHYQEELNSAIQYEPALLPARMALAEVYLGQNSGSAALQLLDQAPAAQKNELPFVIARNWAYLATGKWSEAGKGVDAVLRLGKVPQGLLQQGILKMVQRDFLAARGSFEEALKQTPDDYKALSLLLQSYEANHQQPAGVERIREYASQRPASAPVQFFLGEVMAEHGRRDEARKAFELAKAADPSLKDADVAIAVLDADQRLNPSGTTVPAAGSKRAQQ